MERAFYSPDAVIEQRWYDTRRVGALVVHGASVVAALAVLFGAGWFYKNGTAVNSFGTALDGDLVGGFLNSTALSALMACAPLVAMLGLHAIPAYGMRRGAWPGDDRLYFANIVLFGIATTGLVRLWDSAKSTAFFPGTFGIFFAVLLIMAVSSDWAYSRRTWGWGGQVANLVLHIGGGLLVPFLWYAFMIVVYMVAPGHSF